MKWRRRARTERTQASIVRRELRLWGFPLGAASADVVLVDHQTLVAKHARAVSHREARLCGLAV